MDVFRLIEELDIDFDALFNASPNAYVLFDTRLFIAGCNDAYLASVGRERREDIVGRYLFDAFPSAPDSESYRLLRQSLDHVLLTQRADTIALIPYDVSPPGGGPEMRYWSATHSPVFGADGTLRYILQHTVDVTELRALREQAQDRSILEAGLLTRARKVQAESERLKDLFAQAPGFVGILTGPDHVFEIANAAYRRLVGGRNLVGLAVRDALPEVVDQGFVGLLDEVWRTGTPYVGHGVPVLLHQGPDLEEERFVDFVYQPLRDDHGTVYGIFVLGNDVTEQKRAEDRLTTIAQESAHRVKNTLAMAQAVVSASIREAKDLPEAGKTILDRLAVLAITQPALIEGTLAPADIALVVPAVMELHRDLFGRIEMSGPHAALEPATSQGLALILHELATNAIKYGALSSEGGRVAIDWRLIADEGRVELVWQESGGPVVCAPASKGFGTRLIERALPAGSGNSVAHAFHASGVTCRCSLALA